MKMAIAMVLLFAVLSVAGLGVYYWRVGQELDTLRASLVTEEQLANPDDPETASAIEKAPVPCARVYELRANPIARRLRGDEIRALWAHCERIADIAAGRH